MPDPLTLTPGAATLADLERIWREGLAVRLDPSARAGIEASAARIAAAADEADHHPDIDLRYNWVGLRLVSHDVGGLTERDIELAGEISRIADDLGSTRHHASARVQHRLRIASGGGLESVERLRIRRVVGP